MGLIRILTHHLIISELHATPSDGRFPPQILEGQSAISISRIILLLLDGYSVVVVVSFETATEAESINNSQFIPFWAGQAVKAEAKPSLL